MTIRTQTKSYRGRYMRLALFREHYQDCARYIFSKYYRALPYESPQVLSGFQASLYSLADQDIMIDHIRPIVDGKQYYGN